MRLASTKAEYVFAASRQPGQDRTDRPFSSPVGAGWAETIYPFAAEVFYVSAFPPIQSITYCYFGEKFEPPKACSGGVPRAAESSLLARNGISSKCVKLPIRSRRIRGIHQKGTPRTRAEGARNSSKEKWERFSVRENRDGNARMTVTTHACTTTTSKILNAGLPRSMRCHCCGRNVLFGRGPRPRPTSIDDPTQTNDRI